MKLPRLNNNYRAMKKTGLILFVFAVFGFLACEDEEVLMQEDDRDAIAIAWNVEETSDEFNDQYFTCTIEKDSTSDTRIFMKNFANLGDHVVTEGIVEGDSIFIPQQSPDGNPLEGSGVVGLDKEKIYFNYTIDFGAQDVAAFSATFNKGPIAIFPGDLLAGQPYPSPHK